MTVNVGAKQYKGNMAYYSKIFGRFIISGRYEKLEHLRKVIVLQKILLSLYNYVHEIPFQLPTLQTLFLSMFVHPFGQMLYVWKCLQNYFYNYTLRQQL
jgi:hypothetical protein